MGGYEDEKENFINVTRRDNAGKVASSYPGDTEKYPESVPTGAFCEAEVTIGVENAGSFKDYVSIYDDDYNEYSAIFNLEVQ